MLFTMFTQPGCLYGLRLYVPVNNFSVMSGQSHRFLGITSTFWEVNVYLAQGSLVVFINHHNCLKRGRTGAVVSASDFGPRGPGLSPGRSAVRCDLEQVTFTPCLVLVKPRKPWTDDRLGQTVTRLETMLCLMC